MHVSCVTLLRGVQDEVPVSLADERAFHDDIAKDRENLYVPEPMLSKVWFHACPVYVMYPLQV